MFEKTVLALALLAGAFVGSGCDHHHGHDAPPAPAGVTPVQHEMRLLHEAMRDAVTAMANGDVRPVGHNLHKVHGAKEATAKALEKGTYKPPKNGDKLARFQELDEAFHHELEGIVSASAKNDVVATSEAVGRALTKCNGCHSEFRN